MHSVQAKLMVCGLSPEAALLVADHVDVKAYNEDRACDRIQTIRDCLGNINTALVLQRNPSNIRFAVYSIEKRLKQIVLELEVTHDTAKFVFTSHFDTAEVPSPVFQAAITVMKLGLTREERDVFLCEHPDAFLFPPIIIKRIRAKVRDEKLTFADAQSLWATLVKSNAGSTKTVNYEPKPLYTRADATTSTTVSSAPPPPSVRNDTPCRIPLVVQVKNSRKAEIFEVSTHVRMLADYLSDKRRVGNREMAYNLVLFRQWLIDKAEDVLELLQTLERLGAKNVDRLITSHSGLIALGRRRLEGVLTILQRHRISLPSDLNDLAIPEHVVRARINALRLHQIQPANPLYKAAFFASTQTEFWNLVDPKKICQAADGAQTSQPNDK